MWKPGGDTTVLVIAQHQQAVPPFSVRAPQVSWDWDWNQGWFLITTRILGVAPGAAELGSGSICGWMNQAEEPAARDSLAVSGVLCVHLSCPELNFPVFLEEHPKDQKSHPQQQLAPAPPFRWGSLGVKLELWYRNLCVAWAAFLLFHEKEALWNPMPFIL